jgi:hypothetical protein
MRNSSKIYGSYAEYIGPETCGSIVGYKIVKTGYGYIDAPMTLSDCNRLIQWEFGFRGNRPQRYAEALKKIDRAIAVFQKFRAALELARPRQTRKIKKKQLRSER